MVVAREAKSSQPQDRFMFFLAKDDTLKKSNNLEETRRLKKNTHFFDF